MIPYIAILRHLENHTEAVDLYLMNLHLSRLNVKWISVVSLSVIPWVIDLSGELSHMMKNGCFTAILTPRNCDSVPVNLPKSSLKNRFGPKVLLCVWWNFEGVIHWEFVPNGRAVDADIYSQQLDRIHEILRRRYPVLVNRNSSFAAGQCETPYCTNNHDKNSEIGRNRTASTPSIRPWSCAIRLPSVLTMAHCLCGRNLAKIEAVEVGLTEFFA